MRLSRREALRAGSGLLATAGLAGCVERRVTRRETRVEDSATWALSPDVGAALDREAFEAYVDERADEYGDSGVWGLDGEPAEEFETAYVQRLAVARDGPGQAYPESVDLDEAALVADAAVAVYRGGDGRYRYWLWLGADGSDERILRDVEVSILSARVSFRDTALTDAADVSGTGDAAAVALGGPPMGSFPLEETTTSAQSVSDRGEGGIYFVDWSGTVDGVQSVNGVCEEERTGEHDFFWSIAAGYSLTEQV